MGKRGRINLIYKVGLDFYFSYLLALIIPMIQKSFSFKADIFPTTFHTRDKIIKWHF